jgi:hypothetical protein
VHTQHHPARHDLALRKRGWGIHALNEFAVGLSELLLGEAQFSRNVSTYSNATLACKESKNSPATPQEWCFGVGEGVIR